jgi:hypothetical protein
MNMNDSNNFHLGPNADPSTPAQRRCLFISRPHSALQVLMLFCLPAMLLATDVNFPVKSSRAPIRRCVSLSGEMNREVEYRQIGSTRRPAVYSPCHTPPPEMATPKRRINNVGDRNAAPSLRTSASDDHLPLRQPEGCMYTQLQTQLYPNIHF